MRVAVLQVTSDKDQVPRASALGGLKVGRGVPDEPGVEVTSNKYQVANERALETRGDFWNFRDLALGVCRVNRDPNLPEVSPPQQYSDVEGGAPSPPRHPNRMPLRCAPGQLSSCLDHRTSLTGQGGHGGPPSMGMAFVSSSRNVQLESNPARPEASPYLRSKTTTPKRLASWITFTLLIAALIAKCPSRTSAADTKAPVSAAPGSSPVTSTGPSFDTFRPIADQNIFNPSRVGRSARVARTEVAKPIGDSISFVGTMEYEKGYFAFFDSPNAKFRSVLTQGGTVADFTVKRVTPGGVELTHGNQTLSLQIAQQLTRAEGADWVVSAAPPRVESATAPSAEGGSSAPAIPADASETLKRLMEQRQKQLKE